MQVEIKSFVEWMMRDCTIGSRFKWDDGVDVQAEWEIVCKKHSEVAETTKSACNVLH